MVDSPNTRSWPEWRGKPTGLCPGRPGDSGTELGGSGAPLSGLLRRADLL